MAKKTRQAHSWPSAAKKLGAVLALVVIGLLALPSTAFAGEAIMDTMSRVVFKTDEWKDGEVHDLTITVTKTGNPTRLVVKDRGAMVIGHWGFYAPAGCMTDNVSDLDGSFPATCSSTSPITSFWARLDRDGRHQSSDFFSADPSAASVSALIEAGGGNDVVNVRDGLGGDTVFCGAGFDWVRHDPGDVVVDCETADHGDYVLGAPAVSSWAFGRLDVFWRGVGGSDLRHKWFDGGWWGAETLASQLTSDPAAVSWAFGRIDVFWRGAAGDLRHKWYDGRWSAEESLGSQLPLGSSPAVSSWGPGRLDVFWRGAADDLRHKWFSNGSWSVEESLGGTLLSDPDAVSWGPNRIDVFAGGPRASGPASNDLIHRWYASTWSAWESLGGTAIFSSVAVVSRGPNILDVFFRGPGNALWRRPFGGTSWAPAVMVGGSGQLGDSPGAVASGGGRIDVFLRTTPELLQVTIPGPVGVVAS